MIIFKTWPTPVPLEYEAVWAQNRYGRSEAVIYVLIQPEIESNITILSTFCMPLFRPLLAQ